MAIQRNKHLINHLPHVYELEDLIRFCGNYKELYIYGYEEEQEYILKLLDLCGIKTTGYIVTYGENEKEEFFYRKLPVYKADEILKKKDAGIILGLSERLYDQIIPWFRKIGYTSYFQMTEHTLMGIAEQLKPRAREEMTFEISLADHCNLSCQMCDHFSQLSEPWFVDISDFERLFRGDGG